MARGLELMAGVPWPWLLWWLGCLALLPMAWQRPVVAIAVHVMLQYGIYRYSPESQALLTTRLLDATALLSLLLAWRWRRSRPAPPDVPRAALAIMWTLAAWVALSLLAALHSGRAYPTWLHHDPSLFFQAACLFSAAALSMRDRIDTIGLAGAISAAAVLHAAHQGVDALRLEAYAAALAVIALPMALLLVASARSMPARGAGAVAALLLLSVALWSRNRAAFVALGAGLLCAAALWLALRRASPSPGAAVRSHRAAGWLVGVLLLALVGGLAGGGYQRFAALWQSAPPATPDQQLDLGTAKERLVLWQAAWDMAKQAPFLGVGPGNYANTEKSAEISSKRLTAHSNYFSMLAETGFVGLVLYLALFVAALVSLAPLLAQANDWRADTARALFASLMMYLVQGLFNARHDLVLAYLIAGWAASLRQARESDR